MIFVLSCVPQNTHTQHCKALAIAAQRAMIMSLVQPSPQLLLQFDKVLLMSKGSGMAAFREMIDHIRHIHLVFHATSYSLFVFVTVSRGNNLYYHYYSNNRDC